MGRGDRAARALERLEIDGEGRKQADVAVVVAHQHARAPQGLGEFRLPPAAQLLPAASGLTELMATALLSAAPAMPLV